MRGAPAVLTFTLAARASPAGAAFTAPQLAVGAEVRRASVMQMRALWVVLGTSLSSTSVDVTPPTRRGGRSGAERQTGSLAESDVVRTVPDQLMFIK